LRKAAALGALLAATAWQAAAAAPQAIVTILDGEAALIRGAQRFAIGEGMRLRGDDIVHTTPAARLTRVEFTDGSVLDLGPDTRLMIAARGPRLGYVAQGWAKLAAPKGGGDAALGSPSLGLSNLEGSAVLRVAPDHSVAYLESGQVHWQDRRDAAPAPASPLREGHAALLRGADAAQVAARPPADWLKDLPRAFADSLPQRARMFQAKLVEPAGPSRPAYAELAPWLHAEPAVRQGLAQRFVPLAQDKPFRAALVAEMKQHPEWDRVLFPEKYRPKPKPKPVVAVKAAPAPEPAPAPASTDLAIAPSQTSTVSEKP
jgi:hypothetical protein